MSTGSEDYRYTGKHEDPTDLYYFGARYYDPLVGRFTTRDTVFGSLSDPQSQNKYVYCLNNPHKYIDPDGKAARKFGASYSWSVIGPMFGSGVGIVMVNDDQGWVHFAAYREVTTGGYVGQPNFDAGIDFGYSPSPNSLENVEGNDVNLYVDVAVPPYGGGVAFEIPADALSSGTKPEGLGYTVHLGAEIALTPTVGGGVSYTNTDVVLPLGKIRNPYPRLRDRWYDFLDYCEKYTLDNDMQYTQQPLE